MLGLKTNKQLRTENEFLKNDLLTKNRRIDELNDELAEDMPEDTLGDMINALPEGVVIRRIRPKTAGNNWLARFKGGTEYYGTKLEDALYKLFKNNETVANRWKNNKGEETTDV